ncbi:hypothetical protein JAAARDRAFT_41287 [Jaapia argillacea MUCL 33604]|uniref:Uncharacterized protein n=1 Tax=Jaapia argillacea MUCL 33604 TaxID=933084 RepID=A0A067P8V8_9AGAM|nr:hypothetical protein JAAARDRAFT_41287 [Jaapia argillacea MUCL 33604]
MALLPVPGFRNAPPPRSRVTWYRLILVSFIVGFAIPKWVLASRNFQESANDVDFVSSLLGTAGLVVTGWWESDPPRRLRWFFETDWGIYLRYWRRCSRALPRTPHPPAFKTIGAVHGLLFLWMVFVGLSFYLMHVLDSHTPYDKFDFMLCAVGVHLLCMFLIFVGLLPLDGDKEGFIFLPV